MEEQRIVQKSDERIVQNSVPKAIDYIIQELSDLEKQQLLEEKNVRIDLDEDSESIETIFDESLQYQ